MQPTEPTQTPASSIPEAPQELFIVAILQQRIELKRPMPVKRGKKQPDEKITISLVDRGMIGCFPVFLKREDAVAMFGPDAPIIAVAQPAGTLKKPIKEALKETLRKILKI